MSHRIWDFPGGIHPPENKKQSSENAIQKALIPGRVIIPLQQHIGSPAKPCVEVGDRVLKGQKIGDATGFVSLPVHASTSGVVEAIELRPVQHPSKMDSLCVVIKTDGDDRWCEHTGINAYQEHSKKEVLNLIREAGIAGMGGAGFPSVVKLGIKPDQTIKYLILNAVECEPYITADDRLMRERADQIIQGLQIMAWLIEPEKTLVGIEDNKPQAIEAMKKAAADTNIEIVVVPTKYPSGGEKQLIYMLTGKEVRSGGIPADVGAVCHNTGTAYAVKRAIIDGEPLVSRITTLTGDGVAQRGNYDVLLGTQVGELLHQFGVQKENIHRLIMGGPMMGFAIHDPQVPVVKTTNCLLVPTTKELPDPAPEQPCIRCGSCAQACPVNLLPQQLYWFAKTKEFEKAAHYNLADCIECGACSYVCPSNIPLVQYYRFAKGAIRIQEQENRKSDHARIRFEARQARLEKEEHDKELKRQERAKAAAAKQAQKKAEAADKPSPDTAAAPTDITKLQTAAASTMKRYKEAQKALEQAEKNNTDNLEALQTKVTQLKDKADKAKNAFIAAKSAEKSSPPPATLAQTNDPFAALKKASADDFAAYKNAEKAWQDAKDKGTDDIETLSQRMAELKARSDASKAAMKEARAKEKEQIQQQNAAKDPLKVAKMEVAKAQVLLKKANKAILSAGDADDAQKATLESAVQTAEDTLKTAQDALQKLEGENA